MFHYKKTLIALSAALMMSCSTVEYIFSYNSPRMSACLTLYDSLS